MKILNRKKILTTAAFIFGIGFAGFAQTGQVNIDQDTIITNLMELKTEMGKEGLLGDRYKIQIFSGDNSEASDIIQEFRKLDSKWPSTMEYDTPNYKVWIGNFRNKLEADRALVEIKENYPAAFRFRPGRN